MALSSCNSSVTLLSFSSYEILDIIMQFIVIFLLKKLIIQNKEKE